MCSAGNDEEDWNARYDIVRLRQNLAQQLGLINLAPFGCTGTIALWRSILQVLWPAPIQDLQCISSCSEAIVVGNTHAAYHRPHASQVMPIHGLPNYSHLQL